MKLKRVAVRDPVPFASSVDKTLNSDWPRGKCLEFVDGMIKATSDKGVKYIPLENVVFMEPLPEVEERQAGLFAAVAKQAQQARTK